MKNQLKRVLSILLCVLLCVSLLPAAVFAEGENTETEQIGREEGLVIENGQEDDPALPEPEEGSDPAPSEPESEPLIVEGESTPVTETTQSGNTPAAPVSVTLILEPAEMTLAVYDAGENEVQPDEGVWLLMPGEYRYSASCEGYTPVSDGSFTVTAETTSVTITLTAVVPEGENGETEQQEGDGEGAPADENGEQGAVVLLEGYIENEPVRYTDSTDDPDALFSAYVNKTLYPQPRRRGVTASGSLNAVELYAYNTLKPLLQEVAAGTRSSTEFSIPVADMGFSKTSWTSEELGVPIVDGAGQVTQQASAQLGVKIAEMISTRKIIDALMADLPAELYWFDKTVGMISGYGYSWYTDGSAILLSGNYTFSFTVAAEFSLGGGAYAFNTAIGQSVQTTLQTAQGIVSSHAAESDQQKLTSYKNEICQLAGYNYYAADDSNNVAYGNPWQLIWVFDNDPSTSVVCEGYSKAFQYLCDLSSFTGSTRCLSVSGTMNGGNHMWNIVRLDDGLNYLVDVTNCDSGMAGEPDKLFLVRAESGTVAGGYVIRCGGSAISYCYDASTRNVFDVSDLSLRLLGTGSCGSDLTWTMREDGCLEFSGTGAMTNYIASTQPWADYRASITSIEIPSGVTSIGNYAFYNCSNLTDTTVNGSALTRIGNYAFSGCGAIINVVIPAGVTDIGNFAFNNCAGLATVTIPQSVTNIGASAFSADNQLASFSVAAANTAYCDADGVLYSKDMTRLVKYPAAKAGASYAVPAGVTSIENYAFESCAGLTSVTVPSGVTSVGSFAFGYNDDLASVVFNGAAPSIASNAFYSTACTVSYPTDDASWTSVAGQNYGGTLTWLSAEPEPLTLPAFASHSVLLSGEIGVNFYMDLSGLSETQKAASYMVFTVNGREQSDAFDAGHTNPSTGTYYGFTCLVSSIEMADTITAVFHYCGDRTVSQSYSVKDYVDYVNQNPNQYSESERTLVAALGNYGARVQPFLAAGNGWTLGTDHVSMTSSTNYSEREYSEINSATAASAFFKDTGSSQVTKVSFSMDLQSKTSLYVFFKVNASYRGAVSATLDGAAVSPVRQLDGRYRVTVPSIAAHELGTTHTIVFSAGGDCTVTVSALSYVNAVLNSSSVTFNNNANGAYDAMASLYRYYAAADSYLHPSNDSHDQTPML